MRTVEDLTDSMMRILLAEDDSALRRVLEFKLRKKGYGVKAAPNGLAALDAMNKEGFDLLLADIRMPAMNGIELLMKAKALDEGIIVVLMTAHATIEEAVTAVRMGAYDYLVKPFDDEQLFHTIQKALELRRLRGEVTELRAQLRQGFELDAIIGVSEPIRALKEKIRKIAPTNATVLITGESGTGKELVARAIHGLSPRVDSHFVPVSCAAIPRELLEVELFGHVQGAFTGATRDREGRFQLADGGTLFLDEVAEIPLDLQAKLLRAIQELAFEPVGAEKTRQVDVRILAATNVKLRERVVKAQFREDLYYRLNVIPVHVPPLRERREDIPLLAEAFAKQLARRNPIKFEDGLMMALTNHDWPGNVRELQNLISRMVLLRQTEVLSVRDIPKEFLEGLPQPEPNEPDRLTFHEVERRMIVNALHRANWNRTKAAEILAIPRHVLIYRMKKYEIKEGQEPWLV